MKKLAFLLFLIPLSAMAESSENPMFSPDAENSVGFYAAQGVGAGSLLRLVYPGIWDFEPATLMMIQYSQPVRFFRMPARINFAVAQNLGYQSDAGLSFFAVGISWDFVPLHWHGFYMGLGIGPYMRDSGDERVSSRLVFGERFFIGKNITDRWRLEFMTQHFSTGDFSEINKGFNFAGFAVNYSF